MLDKNIVIKKLDDQNIPQFLSWRGTDRYIWQILEQEIVCHNKKHSLLVVSSFYAS